MNIWFAKLGGGKLKEKDLDDIQNVLNDEFDIYDIDSIRFEYKAHGVHYLSYNIEGNQSKKEYNFIDPENNLTAYSGIFVGTNPDIIDYRSAESIHQHSKNPDFFDSNISGNFAVIRASNSEFQCFVDNLGFHNVFYFKDSDGHVYISNYIQLIRLFKKSEINTDAFLDWITIESVLFQETEEKEISTLPEYGILKWNQDDNSFDIHQYKDVSDVVYNETPQSSLLDKVVTDFKSSARYLSNYHKCTHTLSGGYDSRLILSTFWGLENQNMDSYSYNDNYYDVKIARKVARDFGIPHKVLEFSNEIPTFEHLQDYLVKTRFPFFKYSEVFSYLVKNSLDNIYKNGIPGVLIKGGGGNSDRRIIEKSFLDDFEEDEAISKLAESTVQSFAPNFFDKDALKYIYDRFESYYRQKYLPVISGRGKDHKLNCLLFKVREKNTTRRISKENQTLFSSLYLPLTMDSFQTLIFNCRKTDLYRGHKQSIYHQLFNAFTHGEDKPIHFSSGLHWEASKLSRGFVRIKRQVIEKRLEKIFNYKEKKTTQIKSKFFVQNRSEAMEILHNSRHSFIWDFMDQDTVIKHFQKSSDYSNDKTQFIFKNVLPILKLETDGLLKNEVNASK